MSWHYLQGQEAASWEGSSLDGAPSALLKLIPTPERSCSQDKPTDALIHSRFGMTSQPLTESNGLEPSTLCPVDSPAKTLAAQETEKGLMGSGLASGARWRELFVRCDPVSSSWKTHRCLWVEVLPWSSVTLPQWGMMRGGVCWERIMPEHHTDENGHGLWPTPRCTEARMKPRAPIASLLDGTRSHGWDLCEALWDAALTHNREWPGMVAPGEITEGGMPNPRYWEWLMGWPIGWTDVTQSATAKYQEWRRWHGGF